MGEREEECLQQHVQCDDKSVVAQTRRLSPTQNNPIRAQLPVLDSRSTGAESASPSRSKGREKLTLWHSKENKRWAVHWWWPWLFFPFFFFFSLLQRFIGQRSLTKLQNKQNSVNCWQTRLVVTCAWWVSDRVWWTFLILSLWCYFFEMFWEARSPPPRAHLLSHDNLTNGFHCSSPWPLTPEL